MKTFFAIVGFVVVALIVGTCVACSGNGHDDRSLGQKIAYHERSRCYEDDCDNGGHEEGDGGDGRGGDGGYSDGNQGYGGGGGRSGDYDGGPGDDCRNACGNTIIVPSPGGGGGGQRV